MAELGRFPSAVVRVDNSLWDAAKEDLAKLLSGLPGSYERSTQGNPKSHNESYRDPVDTESHGDLNLMFKKVAGLLYGPAVSWGGSDTWQLLYDTLLLVPLEIPTAESYEAHLFVARLLIKVGSDDIAEWIQSEQPVVGPDGRYVTAVKFLEEVGLRRRYLGPFVGGKGARSLEYGKAQGYSRNCADAVLRQMLVQLRSRATAGRSEEGSKSGQAGTQSVTDLPASVSTSLQARLRRIADDLRRVPQYYPPHLTPVLLAELRQVAPYSPGVSVDSDELYSSLEFSAERGAPAIEAIEASTRTVLLGDPGSGKSTLSRAVVIRALDASDQAVAVHVSAPILIRAVADGEDWLSAVAKCALTLPLDSPDAEDCLELTRHLLASHDAVVVLDGIDEVFDPEERRLVDEVVRAFAGLPGRVLLTSRLMGYRPLPGWDELVVLPLRGSFGPLAKAWHVDDSAAVERALNAFIEDSRVRDLAESPVLAGMFLSLASDASVVLEGDIAWLYSQVVTRLTERRWKSPHHPMRSDAETMALLDAYSDAAWAMAGMRGTELASRWEVVTSYRMLRDAGVDVELLRSGELLIGYGESASMAGVDAPWIWLHRSFADYFVAVRLLKAYRAAPEVGLRVLADTAQFPAAWHNVHRFTGALAAVAERIKMGDALQELVIEGDPGSAIERTLWVLDFGNLRTLRRKPEAANDHSQAWHDFARQPFPENVATMRLLGDAFPDGEEQIPDTEDARLAVWVWNRTHQYEVSKISDTREASDDLIDRCLDSELGPWVAFNIGALSEHHAERRAETLSPYAGIGLRLSSRVFATIEPDGYANDAVCRQMLKAFEPADVSDPRKVDVLLDVLASVNAKSSDMTRSELLGLRDRLGPRRTTPTIQNGGPLVTDTDALTRVIASRMAETIGADWMKFARLAIATLGTDSPLRPEVLTSVPGVVTDSDNDDERGPQTRLVLLTWAASEGPQMLDQFAGLLSFADEHQIQIILERLGERVRGAERFIDAIGVALAREGCLHKWRSVLLELGAVG